jgi:hypothetical protein
MLHEAEPGEIQTQDGQQSHRREGANGLGKRSLVMGDVRVPEKIAIKASVMPLCQNNKYTICGAQDEDASPSCRPFIKFHLWKNATSQTPTIKALYDTGAGVSLIMPSDFEAIKRSGVVIGEIPGMTYRSQNASQQPMQTEGAWRVRLYLKGRPLSAAMIVTNDVAQSIIGMNIIGPRRLVMDPVTCTVDLRDEGAAAALGVLGQREDGTIADVGVLRVAPRAPWATPCYKCLETVGRAGSKVYSALDCSSTFWQLELQPSDRPFTAFIIPGKGQYHWRTCPQGLMGAPASFS